MRLLGLGLIPLLVVAGVFVIGQNQIKAQPIAPKVSSMTWVWSFGFRGSTFVPLIDLESNASILAGLTRLDQVVGRDNLSIVRAVAIQRGFQVHNDDVVALSHYVSVLHTYAKFVVGWEGLGNFNLTTRPNIYNTTSELALLGIDGIWIDQTGAFFKSVGNVVFNSMMQNLTDQHPNLFWILNYAGSAAITPLPGTTWGNVTYASDSPTKGTVNNINPAKVALLNQLYPGRVMMHFDADARNPSAPMSLFGGLNSSQEISIVRNMVLQGQAENFTMLYPFVGANNDNNGTYEGTIYNSLSSGLFSRDTFTSWLLDMSQGRTYNVTFFETGLPIGASWKAAINGVMQGTQKDNMTFVGIPYGNITWTVGSKTYLLGNLNFSQGPIRGSINVPMQHKVNITFDTQAVVS